MTKITTEELERLVALLDDNAPHVAGWQDGDAGEDIPLDAGLADSAHPSAMVAAKGDSQCRHHLRSCH